MSVYARFKKDPEGFRKLVELLELTPNSRRQRMIDVGMEEDPEYTRKALECMMSFADILTLPDVELAEVCAEAPPRMLGYAFSNQPKENQDKMLRCSKTPVAAEARTYFDMKLGPIEISGAQVKIVEVARKLERRGLVRAKRIPA